ncbi:MAG: hypothetical protein DBP02_00350 [gamma proteobacterium symbiont of Ctena orbiculata]|nr:MAG: hypothetical protein DBP02_00350 [gamma proteobacterium symbiont of Ctena orbiculata]
MVHVVAINHQLWEGYQLTHFALSFRQGYHCRINKVATYKTNQGIPWIVVNIYILGIIMHYDKRLGMGPIPASPERYINAKQVDGLSILKKFGWKLICIRRPSNGSCETLMKNGHDKAVGILGEDGILRINPDIQIRHSQKG